MIVKRVNPNHLEQQMDQSIADVINIKKYSLESTDFRAECKQLLDRNGVLVLKDFLTPSAKESVRSEGIDNRHLAYYSTDKHNIYLSPSDPEFPQNHTRNREVCSSKGCITTDQIPAESALRILYYSNRFREFLCAVLGEIELYEYADPLSSINLHYANEGQELGWHFDNSSFAITLMIQSPEAGGGFEYVKNVRNADIG